MNFFDPQLTSDGKDYKVERFKDISRERYLISKHTNTSYTDTAEISPLERRYLLEAIIEDLERKKSITESIRNQN